MLRQPPLLSVCIPTYHQPQALERLLRAVLPQLTSEVEVVIRDDSVEDASEKIVHSFKNTNSVRYFRGKKEGLDVAILFLTREARGKYIWWFGDDLMVEGSLEKVLEFLKSNPQTSFLYINSKQTGSSSPNGHEVPNRKFLNGEEAVTELVDMLGFITATIFEREKALPHLFAAEKHIGSAWVCLFIILSVLTEAGEKHALGEPLIISEPRDPAHPTWYDGFTVFAINFFHILSAFKGKFSNGTIRKTLAKNFDGIWKGILVYRAKGYAHGLGAKTVTIPLIARYYWSFPGFWISLPFLALPRSVARILYAIYLKVRSPFRS